MKDIGYIKLHRKILTNPIVCKDCETLSIWIYLLLNANYQETTTLFKGKKIILKPRTINYWNCIYRKTIIDKQR